MSHLSQREAAQRWGVSRATLQRAIKAGDLSAVEGRIDPAEMLRVYGEPKSRPVGRLGEPLESSSEPGGPEPAQVAQSVARSRLTELEAEVQRLRDALAAKEALLAAKDENLTDLRSQVLMLTHDRPAPAPAKKKRWWQRG